MAKRGRIRCWRCCPFLGAVLAMVVVTTPRVSTPEVLYDLVFDEPHKVGEVPLIFDQLRPSHTPSRIVFGHPTVVPSLGPLGDRPLKFQREPCDNMLQQIRFSLPSRIPETAAECVPGSPRCLMYDGEIPGYLIEFDLVVISLEPTILGGGPAKIGYQDSFSVLFDGNHIRRLDFLPDETIRYMGALPAIARFRMGELLRVVVRMDFLSNEWSLRVNDSLIFERELYYRSVDLDMRSMRFSLTGRSPKSIVGLDNIRISIADY